MRNDPLSCSEKKSFPDFSEIFKEQTGMAEDFAANAGEKAAFSEEVVGNGLAPLWEIYHD